MKRSSSVLFSLLFAVLLVFAIKDNTTLAGTTVSHTEEDVRVLPDKYNTGCDTNTVLHKIYPGSYEGVNYGTSAGSLIINFYANLQLNGVVEINDCDFSDYYLRIYNANVAKNKVVFVFNNCKFDMFRSFEEGYYNVEFIFNNCTFVHCSGSNITLNSCYFTDGVVDCLNPYNNVYVNDCYFSNKSMQNIVDNSGVHTDGTQIFGSKTAGCSNIHYNNCRFEMPILLNSANAVNAPLMLQIEFCDASDITFDNCTINGGGYSIYAHTRPNCKINDSYMNNIKVGCSSRWGVLYPDVSDGVQLTNISLADKLYVGSVWKDNKGCHISVTNDTESARQLVVKTDAGDYSFMIPACYTYDSLTTNIGFKDFPFDLDVAISDVNWLVCYDNTYGSMEQIRFVNFTDNEVVLGYENEYYETEEVLVAEEVDIEYVPEEEVEIVDEILAEGKCGNNITWTLFSYGTLVLTGEGSTYDYHSKATAPWYDYANSITDIQISEGIVRLGNQAFRNCGKVVNVQLPASLEIIANNVFIGCGSLKNIEFPSNLKSIGAWSFSGVKLASAMFMGDRDISIGNNNGNLLDIIGK